MPIKVRDNLPAIEVLNNENIFVMTEGKALRQDIRPLEILVLNLMPTKITTETQLLRVLGNTPLQINVQFMKTATYTPKNTPSIHLQEFYSTFKEVKDNKFDGLIITGAPVETREFEDVDYWDELCEIMDWSKQNVTSTLHICWGAQAALYHHYGIKKYDLDRKLSGVFKHRVCENKRHKILLRGFDDEFYAPHSRNTEFRREDIEKNPNLEILAESDEAGIYIISAKSGKQFFVSGHPEYDSQTLSDEYFRDLKKGLNPDIPKNYFKNDDPSSVPVVRWRSHANLLYSNWLNYFVYQLTEYDISRIGSIGE